MSENNVVIIAPGARDRVNHELVELGKEVLIKDPSLLYKQLLDGNSEAIKETMEILFTVIELTDRVKELGEKEKQSTLN